MKRGVCVSTSRVVGLVACLGVFASIAGADIMMTSPGFPYDLIVQGDTYPLEWVADLADEAHELQLWNGWASGWEMIEPAAPAPDGQFIWDSTDAYIGWHAFGAWVNPNVEGEDWYYVSAPGWLFVDPPSEWEGAPLVELDTAPAGGEVVPYGDDYLIEWSGGTPGATVQLWCGDYMIAEMPAGNEGQQSYLWDTGEVEEGTYYLTAWVDPEGKSPLDGGPEWYYITAPGPLVIPEPMTLSILGFGAFALLRVKRRRPEAA